MLTLRVLAATAAVLVIAGVLWDAFETVVLPRGVSRLTALPPWAPDSGRLDDWQTTADGMTAPSIAALLSGRGTAAPGHP